MTLIITSEQLIDNTPRVIDLDIPVPPKPITWEYADSAEFMTDLRDWQDMVIDLLELVNGIEIMDRQRQPLRFFVMDLYGGDFN